MQTIEQALQEVRALHEQITRSPAPTIQPQGFLPFPPGVDPVAFAIAEVSQLRELVRQSREAGPTVDWMPAAGVYVGETGTVYTLDVPGVAREDLSVAVIDQQIVVRGQRRPRDGSREFQPRFLEQPCGAFERRLPFPPGCDPEAVEARCTDGVLEIQVKRGERERGGELRVRVQ
jgi:HSP20 family protein